MPPRERAQAAPTTPPIEVKKQVVAGFIVFRRTEEGVKFLLLYRRGSYWNVPKGHFEEGEDAFQAALREVHEETGIAPAELHIVPNFKTYLRYNFRSGNERIYDTVILYLAETEKEQVTITPREHSGYAWFFYPDAMKILGAKYAGTKRIIKQANDFLRAAERRTTTRPDVAAGATTPSTEGTARPRPAGAPRRRRRGRGGRGSGHRSTSHVS